MAGRGDLGLGDVVASGGSYADGEAPHWCDVQRLARAEMLAFHHEADWSRIFEKHADVGAGMTRLQSHPVGMLFDCFVLLPVGGA